MRLLLDQGLPRLAAQALRDAGVDAVHAGTCNLGRASDSEILAWARQNQRIIVTLDADFHALLALSGAAGPSVIRLRIEGLRAAPLAKLVQTILDRCRDDLAKGALVSVTEDHIRIHHLPIRAGAPRPSG